MRTTVIEVEFPLIEPQLKELDLLLEKAISKLNWTSEGTKEELTSWGGGWVGWGLGGLGVGVGWVGGGLGVGWVGWVLGGLGGLGVGGGWERG